MSGREPPVGRRQKGKLLKGGGRKRSPGRRWQDAGILEGGCRKVRSCKGVAGRGASVRSFLEGFF